MFLSGATMSIVKLKVVSLLVSIILIFASVPAIAALSADLKNQLTENPSPYLAMHADDPVAWQAWDEKVLERARKENKLLFVSIGYFACHWCHVMQRESYKDEVIAKNLNENFIPVKVDRELNPALDAYLIEFVQRTRGQAGWPLNVFVTPDGDPVLGLLYMPRDQFRKLLVEVQDLWASNNDYMRNMAAQAAAIQKGQPVKSEKLVPDLGVNLTNKFLQQAMSIADDMQGGFGEQTKFPMVDQLRFMLQLSQYNKLPQLQSFLQTTLDQMATQGLRDHIGGGFYRYTVDPGWQTPHYEKMLYDNAGLAVLYLEAAEVFGRNDYRAIGRETLDFMIRELKADAKDIDGGMVASLSAVDNSGIEGGYYLWQKQTLLGLLSKEEYDVVYRLWNMKAAASAEAGYLPRQVVSPDEVAKELGIDTTAMLKVLAQAQLKLFKVRQNRHVPIDTKQLAAWNGLALYALTQGAKLENGDKYHEAAKHLRNYLVNKLWNGQRLSRAIGKHGPIGQAGLEDYAYAAYGLNAWAQFTGYVKDKELVKHWLDIAWQRFYTATGWVLTDEMLIKSDLGTTVVDDGPMPSPSGLLLQVSWQVAQQTHDQQLQQRVQSALGLGHDKLETQPFYYATHIATIARYQSETKELKR